MTRRPVLTEPALSHVTVFPVGTKLPADFVPANVDRSDFSGPNCLRNGSACDVVVWSGAAQAEFLTKRHVGKIVLTRQGTSDPVS